MEMKTKTTQPLPKVAILLATHNGKFFLRQQLESLKAQAEVEVHIFVSDDGSSDGTLELLDEFSASTNILTFINRKRVFGRSAKNFFYLVKNVDLSGFDFVAFSDQDDVWFDNKLNRAVNCLSTRNINGYSSDVLAYWPTKNSQLYIKKSYPQKPFDYLFEPPGPGCTQVFTVSSFTCFQDFLNKTEFDLAKIDCHDWLAYAYYREHGLGWHIDPVATMYYYQHASNEVGVNRGFSAMKKRLLKVKNLWYKKQVNLIKDILGTAPDIFYSRSVVIKNALNLRRKRSQSLFVCLLILTGFL